MQYLDSKGAYMRLTVATLILVLAAPVWAGKDTGACKNRCDSNYQLCLSRAVSKAAKKSCKTDRKTCKSSCR